MFYSLWSNVTYKKAQFTPTNVQIQLFSTITEKFLVLVKFSNLLLIIPNWEQRFGKKESCNLWDKLWGTGGKSGQ